MSNFFRDRNFRSPTEWLKAFAWSAAAIGAALVITVCCALVMAHFSKAEAGWRPEYAQNTPEIREWFQHGAFMTPEAHERLKPFFQQNGLDLAEQEDYSRNRPLTQQDKNWMYDTRITPEARPRFTFSSCCDHGDRVKAKFNIEKVQGLDKDGKAIWTEKWSYLDPSSNTWKDIPNDVIHHGDDVPGIPPMPIELKREGVLFVYNGKVTCFWPPETEL